MNAFERLAPYIQNFIYRERWDELREVQVAACNVIFNSEKNLLLSTGTASGKTEAAFLPTLTKLYEDASSSVGILYVSPLKALINDQFFRLNYLLKEGHIPVCKWHGDAPQSEKNALIKNPQGVLQITPESLESLLINKRALCYDLFKDLRFIIIDEVHYFMDSPRGIQLICQLERIQKLIGIVPRRIGLSATLGDYSSAEKWLNSGTNNVCITPSVSSSKRNLGIAMERFEKEFYDDEDVIDDAVDQGVLSFHTYLYKNTLNKKAIIFANSRAVIEDTIAHIKKIANENHTRDIYRVHHGNISAILREDTEKEMKLSDDPIVTGATVTLELGIDIGSLDRIAQAGSPHTASSFTQRLGRCGRRGQTSELLFAFLENKKTSTDAFFAMNWELLKGIAILQLYLEEKWVEPIHPHKFPYAILFHQTMAHLAARGETLPAILAQDILTLSSFKNISQEDYKKLLIHLIDNELLQQTEQGGLIVGRKGEKLINHYDFYSVFTTQVEYIVKSDNQVIGTLHHPVATGDQFILSARAWECIDLKEKSNTIFVKRVQGIPKVVWIGPTGFEVHTKILKKMQEVLQSKDVYAYLSENCIKKLDEMRLFAMQSKFAYNIITPMTDIQFAIFPWIGTKQMCALYYAFLSKGFTARIGENGYCLIVESAEGAESVEVALSDILSPEIHKHNFVFPDNIQIPYKYNKFIPLDLLHKQFVEDYVDLDGLKNDCLNI